MYDKDWKGSKTCQRLGLLSHLFIFSQGGKSETLKMKTKEKEVVGGKNV